MKRKIFTLLAAFLALAAFHTNAQDGPYTLAGLNDVDASNVTDNVYPNTLIDPALQSVGVLPGSRISGALTYLDGKFLYKSTAPEFGNASDYFAYDNVIQGGEVSPTMYYIYASNGNGPKLSFQYPAGGNIYDQWELVRFIPDGATPTPNPWGSADAFSIEDGGYLSVPSGVAGDYEGRLIVVRNINTQEMKLMSYREYNTGSTKSTWWPVWLKAERIGSRWARATDFEAFPDFIQINVRDKDGEVIRQLDVEEVKYFKIVKTGSSFGGEGWHLNHDKDSAMSYDGTSVQKYVELFTFLSPERPGQAVTVGKENVLGTEASSANNVFGGKLIWKPTVETSPTLPCNNDLWEQQFAIWFETDGSMSLYPYRAWTYRYGQSETEAILRANRAIVDNYHAYPNGRSDSWEFFKIQEYNGEFVVGPTVLARNTYYKKATFTFEDVTMYNTIAGKRYFYLQTKTKGLGANATPLVLDVVKFTGSDGKIYKKVVLTEKEKGKRSGEDTYYNVPFDSMNLSAHWMVEAIDAKYVNPNISDDENRIIGYRFTNEEGDVLKYEDGTLGVFSSIAANEYDAYLDSVTVNPNTTLPAPATTIMPYADIWKVLALPAEIGSANARNTFFLSNLKDAPILDSENVLLEDKNIRGWGAVIDTTNLYFDTNWILNCGYKSTNDAGAGQIDPQLSFWNRAATGTGGAYCGSYVEFVEIDGVIQRNVGIFDPNQKFTHPCMNTGPQTITSNYNPYRISAGLELELVSIDYTDYARDLQQVLKEGGTVKHDSLYPGTTLENPLYMWDRYEVDSLFNYMYQKPGTYTIAEAIGHVDIFKIDDQLGGRVYAGAPERDENNYKGGDRIVVEMADSLVLTELDDLDHSDDPYKWFYLKDEVTGKYMEMAVINETGPAITQYGYTFTADLKANAAKIRFYQPLVDDKANRYFILETLVPMNEYDSAGNTDAYGYEVDGTSIAGETAYLVITRGSKTIGLTLDPKEGTRWDFTTMEALSKCRVDYIDNDFLADTRMYGAPLTAERWYDNDFSGRFITDQAYEKLNTTAFAANEDSLTFVLVPAAKIVPNTSGIGSIQTPFYAPDRKEVSTNFADAGGYDFGTETRPVQLYYVKRIKKNEAPQYLTVTNENVYVQGLQNQMYATVSGDILSFKAPIAYAGNGVPNAEMKLQMFAVYGKLGLDADKVDPLDCIATKREFTYGQFVFVPAAAWKGNIKDGDFTNTVVQNNLGIGDANVDDDFKVGMVYNADPGDPKNVHNYKLVVTPGGSEGYPASEYVFTYTPLRKDFSCLNFISDYANQNTTIAADDDQVTSLTGDALDTYYANPVARQWAKDYADPSQQWNVETAEEISNMYVYSFNPVALQKRNQEPVEQTQLLEDRYMYAIDEAVKETAYGAQGYIVSSIAVKRYERDTYGRYHFSENFYDDMKEITIEEITNHFPGDVQKVAENNDRRYNGDSAIDYFYKFEDGEILSFDWGIVESIYKDRFIWAKDFDYPVEGQLQAFIDSSAATHYVTLKKSKVDVIAKCGDQVVHYIPYYNIVYTDVDDKEYYLELDQNGKATFVYMTEADKIKLAAEADNDDHKPGMKFCFPYKMEEYNRMQYVGEGHGEDPNVDNTESDFYNTRKVFIQSMATFDAQGDVKYKPSLLKVTSTSVTLAGSIQESLYDMTYYDASGLDATTWFFGDNGASEDVWIRMNAIDAAPYKTTAFLRDATRPDERFAFKNPTTDENGINYLRLFYKTDIPDVNNGNGSLVFQFVDSALLGNYDQKKIWYYNIMRVEGTDTLYLTSAGFDPNGVRPANKYIWQNEGLAYFDTKLASDPTYKQLFGLKWKKAEEGEDENYLFWVVAGVDSTQENTDNSPYYYLSDVNNKLTFRYGGGTSKVATENSALIFEIGQVSEEGAYTGIDDNDAAEGLIVYGGQDNIKVINANGLVELYTVDGRLFKSVEAAGTELTISAPKGILIVKNGSDIVKVVVK